MIDIEGALRAEAAGRTMKRDEPLPFAKGQKFSNLDSYLAHLQELGTRDIPFYERMSDGRYKLVTPFVRDPNIKRVFTRHELLDKYGFSH
ncbi:MAG: hypothetical protein KDJ74_01365 [Notoacmeibacter sp.]|nr:hypothetical protein [Notoacmeibacter sp.]